MSDKYFVGADLIAASNNGQYKPISRVTLAVDDNNVITAGDDTGFEIVASCPYADQDMVNALLERFRGHVYQTFEADETNINPTAELGDGITANGIYGAICKRSDDGSGYVNISAPGKAELDDEYPMDGPISQMINREIQKARSAITKTAEEIRLEIWGEQETSIIAQLGSIVSKVEGAIGVDEKTGNLLSVSSMIEQKADSINATITTINQQINGYTPGEGEEGESIVGIIPRLSTLELDQSGFRTRVEGAIGTDGDGALKTVSSSISAALECISLSIENNKAGTSASIKLLYTPSGGTAVDISSGDINLTGLVTVSGLSSGTTSIDGGCIKTGTISADRIAVANIKVGNLENNVGYQTKSGVTSIVEGTITTDYVNALGVTASNLSGELISLKLSVYDEYVGAMVDKEIAKFALTYTSTGDGMVIKTTLGGLKLVSQGNIQLSPGSGCYTALGGDLVSCQADLQPSSSSYTCGTKTVGWEDIYACGTTFSSVIEYAKDLGETLGELQSALTALEERVAALEK